MDPLSLSNNLVSTLRCDKQDPLPLTKRRNYLFNKLHKSSCLYARTVKGHYGCVNAINFSCKDQQYLLSGGDDMRVLVWKVSCLLNGDYNYITMATTHDSNIFSMATSCDDSFAYSSGNDGQIIKHDFNTGSAITHYRHIAAVYCVDTFPTSPQLFASATEDGCIFITDTREERLTQDMILDESISSYHSVSVNPCDEQLIAVGNETTGAALYDLRNWKKVFDYYIPSLFYSPNYDTTSVCFNSSGGRVFIMHRTHPPVVFSTTSPHPIFVCEDTGDYRNAVTLKSGCFASVGDKEYVVSGSDDFRIYWWQLPSGTSTDNKGSSQEIYPHLVVPGHRSIVNQTRYSETHHVLCSCGVEKSLKLWTPYPQYSDHESFHSLAPPSREHYDTLPSGDDSDDHTSKTVEENERVLAFFDQLIEEDKNVADRLSSLSSDDDDERRYDLLFFLRNRNSHGSDIFLNDNIDSSGDSEGTPWSDCSGNTSSYEPPWSSVEREIESDEELDGEEGEEIGEEEEEEKEEIGEERKEEEEKKEERKEEGQRKEEEEKEEGKRKEEEKKDQKKDKRGEEISGEGKDKEEAEKKKEEDKEEEEGENVHVSLKNKT